MDYKLIKKIMKYGKFCLIIAFLVAIVAALSLQNNAQATRGTENPATDIERGIFVHYPKAKSRGGGNITPTDQITDFKYSGIHWLGKSPQIAYLINPSDLPSELLGLDVITPIKNAFEEWATSQNDNDGNDINFVYGGLTNANVPINPTRDGFNTASWEPLNSKYPNAIAITFYWYNRATKGLVEADTVFNSDLVWSVNGENNAYDLQNIATHEFGHWLVLGDLYNYRDSELTMYGYGTWGETKKSSLGQGDILGIQKAY